MLKSILVISLLLVPTSLFAKAIPTVEPLYTTPGSPFSQDKRDDPAIWIHPTDPSHSLVICSNKDSLNGGLHVYNLRGEELQFLAGGRLNNIDIIPDFFSDGDLMLASERSGHTIVFYKIDTTGQFSLLNTHIKIQGEPYGICGGRGKEDDRYYAFVTTKEGPIQQWELTALGPGKISGDHVRTLVHHTQCEGCIVDREGEYVFIGEETAGVFQYFVDIYAGNKPFIVEEIGDHLKADIEGLTIYDDGANQYLIVSSQGDSTFAIYNLRENSGNRYVGSFQIVDTTETDGIVVTATPLGPDYPNGLFVAHNHKLSNFKFVPWERIAKAVRITKKY